MDTTELMIISFISGFFQGADMLIEMIKQKQAFLIFQKNGESQQSHKPLVEG